MDVRIKTLIFMFLLVFGGLLVIMIPFYPDEYLFVEYILRNVTCSKVDGNIKFVLTTRPPSIRISCKSLSITKYPEELKLTYLKDYNCDKENFYVGTISLYGNGVCTTSRCLYIIEYKGKPAKLTFNSTLCE